MYHCNSGQHALDACMSLVGFVIIGFPTLGTCSDLDHNTPDYTPDSSTENEV